MPKFNQAAFEAPIIRYANKKAITLVELLSVIIIISTLITISYPSLLTYYHRKQLSSGAFELAGTLAQARSLAVTGTNSRSFGVILFSNGGFQIYSFKPGIEVSLSSYSRGEIGKAYTQMFYLNPGVVLRGASYNESKTPIFMVIFRRDGVPTSNGVSFPLEDSNAKLSLESNATNGVCNVIISKTTGLASIE